MTTTITVQAHVSSDFIVQVDVTEDGFTGTTILKNEDTFTLCAYGERVVTVHERPVDLPPHKYAAFSPYQRRVLEERDTLDTKLKALNSFLFKLVFNSLSRAEQFRQVSQQAAMHAYLNVLEDRIEAFSENHHD